MCTRGVATFCSPMATSSKCLAAPSVLRVVAFGVQDRHRAARAVGAAVAQEAVAAVVLPVVEVEAAAEPVAGEAVQAVAAVALVEAVVPAAVGEALPAAAVNLVPALKTIAPALV
jgi:hypothetical protein